MGLAALLFGAMLLAVSTQACMDPYDLVNLLPLDPKYTTEAFLALDVNHDGLINMADMDIHYYHSGAEFAKKKFLKMVDKRYNNGKEVDNKELQKFVMEKPVKLAVFECSYIKSKTQRMFCLKDQILYYVYLVLDSDSLNSFFSSLESKTDFDKFICIEEVEKLKELNKDFGELDIDNFMVEVGKDDSRIIKADFIEYVQQEDLQDEFRTCRRELVDGNARYDVTCLTLFLMDYTMNKLTELDIATVFDQLDMKSNRLIMSADVMRATGCDADEAQRFVRLMRFGNTNTKISYGEFRKYVKSHGVKLHLQRECTRKTPNILLAIKCYKEKLMTLIKDNHTPIWLTISDLDLLFAFEELDFDSDGKISVREDLVLGRKWPKELADKLVKDIDAQNAAQNGVNLEEFHEYVGYPHMVYAMAKCLDLERGMCRVDCFITELKDTIEDMMTQDEVDRFFNYYDLDHNGYLTENEIITQGVSTDQVGYFIRELGMGETKVTKMEFDWFVRQQEINHMFGSATIIGERHDILLKYLSDIMTEYDVQSLFRKLDTESDHEITESDFLHDINKIRLLIQRIDRNKDMKVNFVEFWLYLNTPVNNIRKRYLEEKCTSKYSIEKEEMDCYVEEIFNVK